MKKLIKDDDSKLRFNVTKRLWPRFTPWRGKLLRTKHRCVGFLGLTGAGKTVFITSLVNHFKDFDSASLPIRTVKKKNMKGNVNVTEVKGGLQPRLCKHRFDYDVYRDAFKRHKWPEKTRQLQEYRAWYVRNDKPHTLYDTSLIDIPGERLGDICMVDADFEKWSDNMLKMLSLEPYSQVSTEFIQLASEAADDPKKLDGDGLIEYVRSYKELLVRLVTELKSPAMSPSSFLIDPNDLYIPENVLNMPPKAQKDWLVDNRCSGLDKKHEFAPLPSALKDDKKTLYKKFGGYYKKYCRQIVSPLYKALRKCDSLVVLIDVADMLQFGEGMINAQDKLLEQLIDGLQPGTVLPEMMDRFMPGPRIHRLAFVASKADRIHPSDFGTLQALLKSICGPHAKRRVATTGLDTTYEVCSAVDSTETESNDDNRRVLLFKGENDRTLRCEVPELPEEMPDSIPKGMYDFPEPQPMLPGINRKPPRHIGLENIIDIILA